MGEQMYVISRMEDALTAPLVTESELKRRLCEIIGWPLEELGTLQSEIGILLNGREPDVLDPITHQVPLPVTEEPTRKEWEEWASDEPDPMSYGERDEYWKAKK